jgi:hypothetical protein
MKFQKIELIPSLKAEDYDDGALVIATGYIKDVQAVKTKFNDEGTTSTIIFITDEAETNPKIKDKGVFTNSYSINNLIDAYGEESGLWIGKAVKVSCNKNNFYKKKMLLIEALR